MPRIFVKCYGTWMALESLCRSMRNSFIYEGCVTVMKKHAYFPLLSEYSILIFDLILSNPTFIKL